MKITQAEAHPFHGPTAFSVVVFLQCSRFPRRRNGWVVLAEGLLMQRSTGVVIAVVVGSAAIVAPIWLSVHLAWKESLDAEEARVRYNVGDVLRRSDETRNQMGQGLHDLKRANLPPCSPAEVDVMRRLDLASSYIQAVGRIQGDNLICTSLGTTLPIPLGPATLITDRGVAARLNVRIPTAGDQPMDIFSVDGYAFIIHPNLPIDTEMEGPDISLSLFVPSSPSHVQLASKGAALRPEWFRDIPKGGEATFVDHGYVVCLVRSARGDQAVLAAAPIAYVFRRVTQIALLFVPLGLACGLALAWAVVYVTRRNLSLRSILRAAARRREFFVEYQPIVELGSRRWIGAEALVRWRRGSRIVRPDIFIPSAEESGVITLITQCVATIIAADLPGLLSIDSEFQVAMNLSAPDLRSESSLAAIADILRAEGVRPANLEVEATERGFLQGSEVRELLARIRSLGVSIAIDDFGTGYSSLASLQTLGLDTLKIDKSFVETIGTDGATSQVVLHIIDMAHSLKLEMVAEGVETEEQAGLLKQRGVHYAQGWLFAKPMSIAALRDALQAQTTAERNVAV